MKISACRTCGAEIIWAEMPSGKRCPFDVEPSSAGQWDLEEDRGTVLAVSLQRAEGSGEEGYTSHFATCPNAATHRRGR